MLVWRAVMKGWLLMTSNEPQDDRAEPTADDDGTRSDGRGDRSPANDTERRYGHDESPA